MLIAALGHLLGPRQHLLTHAAVGLAEGPFHLSRQHHTSGPLAIRKLCRMMHISVSAGFSKAPWTLSSAQSLCKTMQKVLYILRPTTFSGLFSMLTASGFVQACAISEYGEIPVNHGVVRAL